jgi:hypothetical protein
LHDPKILLWDVETSLNVVAVFQLKQDYIQPESILSERHLICAAWKWLGESKVNAVSLLDDPKRFAKDIHDDYHVCQKLHDVLNEADVIVAHNGDKFDIRFVEARMIINGFSPLPPIVKLDTMKIAKKRFLFNSNKLDYLGKVLGVGRKKPTSSGLWMRVLKGDEKAIKAMVAYNKGDVQLLERVFLKLRPYMPNHLNRELFGLDGCSRCGSKKLQKRGLSRNATRVYQRFQCLSCGGWLRAIKSDKVELTSRPI